MTHILAKRHIHTLAEFASSNVLLAFDFDGTLAPIVPDPATARLRPGTRRLLAAVAMRYPCVIVSGHARHDLAQRIGSSPVFHLSGNHGLEPWAESPAYARRVHRWVAQLSACLASFPGVVIEDKTYSVTVHYRHGARQRRTEIDALLRARLACRPRRPAAPPFVARTRVTPSSPFRVSRRHSAGGTGSGSRG